MTDLPCLTRRLILSATLCTATIAAEKKLPEDRECAVSNGTTEAVKTTLTMPAAGCEFPHVHVSAAYRSTAFNKAGLPAAALRTDDWTSEKN